MMIPKNGKSKIADPETRSWVFSLLLLVTFIMGVVLIFFVDSQSGVYLSQLETILQQQISLTAELVQLNGTTNQIFDDFQTLEQIIVSEQMLVHTIDDEIERIKCIGVENINGIVSEQVTRSFNVTGSNGIDVSPYNDGVIINASALKMTYDDEQAAITMLFNMTISTEMSVQELSTEVLKTLNGQPPIDSTNNVDVDGVCGTSVYSASNGTVMVDMCQLVDNTTAAFASIDMNFDIVNSRLDQLLIDIIPVMNETDSVLLDAQTTQDATIYYVSDIQSVQNNIDIAGGLGIDVVNDTLSSNTIVIQNKGITSINGINITNNVNIVPGFGVDSVQDNNRQTLTNIFFVPPCVVQSIGLTILPPWFPVTTWTPLQQLWTPEVKTPVNCTDTDIFVPLNFLGATFGQFNMPRGTWTLSMTMILIMIDGISVDMSFAFVSAFNLIPFNSFIFTQVGPSLTYFYSYYHLELTLSNDLIPEGTQFSLQYWGAGGTPTRFIITMTDFSMTRIS